VWVFKKKDLINLLEDIKRPSKTEKMVLSYLSEEEKSGYYKLYGDSVDYIKMEKLIF